MSDIFKERYTTNVYNITKDELMKIIIDWENISS